MWWLVWLACGGPECVELPATCTPLYEPTWDAVYTNTVEPTCAISGCHGGASASGGLAMGSTSASAYDAWADIVTPGDPACSTVVDHLEPAGLGDMPIGGTLPDDERCAIRGWIAEGAEGP